MDQRPFLETKRLILRAFELSDAKDVQRLAGDRAVAEMTTNIPHPYRDGMAEEWIGSHQEHYEKGKGVHFAITTKGEGCLIGAISLMNTVSEHQAEMGYWIGKSYWNQGYCTEAAQAVMEFGFKQFNLVRIHACHFKSNPASGRIMQKLGMKHEGCRRRHVRKGDHFEDLELYGILREEWEALANRNNTHFT